MIERTKLELTEGELVFLRAMMKAMLVNDIDSIEKMSHEKRRAILSLGEKVQSSKRLRISSVDVKP